MPVKDSTLITGYCALFRSRASLAPTMVRHSYLPSLELLVPALEPPLVDGPVLVLPSVPLLVMPLVPGVEVLGAGVEPSVFWPMLELPERGPLVSTGSVGPVESAA